MLRPNSWGSPEFHATFSSGFCYAGCESERSRSSGNGLGSDGSDRLRLVVVEPLDVGLSIKSDGAAVTDLTLLVTIDSARAEVGRLDVRTKPREAANSDGVPALD